MMVAKPKVSVVMSVFNDAKNVGSAVESILAQTFTDFELIIIDDGSVDDTAEVLCQVTDRRVVVLRNDQNLGLTKSLNRALKYAHGQYIARHDADDLSKVERFARQVDFLDAHHHVAVVGSAVELEYDDARPNQVIQMPTQPDIIRDMLFYHHCLIHGATMIRRSAMEAIGDYNDYYEYAQDRDLWFRLLDRFAMANLSESLYLFRISRSSITATKRALQRSFARRAVLECLARGLSRPSPLALARFYWLQSIDEHLLGHDSAMESFITLAMQSYPQLNDDVMWLSREIVNNTFDLAMTTGNCQLGIEKIDHLLRKLPPSLSRVRSRRRWILAEYYAACAFLGARNEDWGATREFCIRSWSSMSHAWRNVGLAKLFVGALVRQTK